MTTPATTARLRATLQVILATCALACMAWLQAATPVAADAGTDAASLLARYKAAAGGVDWDSVASLRTEGRLATGGLEGTYVAVQDLRSLRSVARYELGPVKGANGYDGRTAWSQDPGGEVAALDAPAARRRVLTQAWLDAFGYWFPDRLAAQYGKVTRREDGGRAWDVVEATPAGGDPVVIWLDPATHLLARVQQRQDQDTLTTVFDDWRDTGNGLRLPFHAGSTRTDAAGRTDPRTRSEARITRAAFDVPIRDDDFAMPAMAPTARIDAPAGITRIPFDLVSNHIYVDGVIDGRKARFLVDTGGVNLLTPAAAERFGLAGKGKLAARGVGDQMVDMALAQAKEVRVGDAVLADPVFYVIDLGPLPKVEGVPADGLVGYEMFRRFGVTLDYARHELVLSEPARFVPPAGAHVVPFQLADRIPIVHGTLDGLPLRISIDTGSRVSLTLHSPLVNAHDLVERYRAAPEAVLGWGVGGPSRARPARFGTLALGDLAIGGIAGDLYTGDKGAFASPDIDANLGGGLLKRFTVAFDYAAGRMYLAPNATFAVPDPFDRSGLFLLAEGDALEVADVAPASAAAAAGLKQGDQLLAIGGEPVGARTLDAWRQRLRELPAGTHLAVAWRRGGTAGKSELVLADRVPAQQAP